MSYDDASDLDFLVLEFVLEWHGDGFTGIQDGMPVPMVSKDI